MPTPLYSTFAPVKTGDDWKKEKRRLSDLIKRFIANDRAYSMDVVTISGGVTSDIPLGAPVTATGIWDGTNGTGGDVVGLLAVNIPVDSRTTITASYAARLFIYDHNQIAWPDSTADADKTAAIEALKRAMNIPIESLVRADYDFGLI